MCLGEIEISSPVNWEDGDEGGGGKTYMKQRHIKLEGPYLANKGQRRPIQTVQSYVIRT